ncbi:MULTISPECIES: hypothetical protein [Staphylococcus]|uniref:hypothetical protein n=1 Tax=Staphylococcus TaxID=1279 RepID=UPI0012F04B20|nr:MULTISPECIES: hypothetical protein [Staphylococcus]MBM6508392.1 hypothetical protein [Staphylococcus pasteuri]MBM6508401.1 hypothetical protein [Staphylococcus pasteuri]QQT21613.1 hypothetical protein I6J08_12795 [Staphylococcus pasteuri]QQT21622.1 hypothetical protein I6J08_12840 [Staphylococcus pasteuri]VXC41556.1 conserved hypothetical protein [Staphylococcus sp. 8AQ]
MREQLRKFKNQDVVLTGELKSVKYRRYSDRFSIYKENVHILLKNVKINGEIIDHIWLQERNKFYEEYKSLTGQTVKFKVKIKPYIKKKNFVYVEDYGIQRLSKILSKEVYDEQKPFKKK